MVSALVPMHGVGNRGDLPLPFTAVVIGACVVLVISFGALALWRGRPVEPSRAGRLVPVPAALARSGRVLRGGAAVATAVLAAVTLAALLFGSDGADNPAPYVIFVWLWIGLPFLSVLLGPVWRAVNPLRWVQRGIASLARVEPAHAVLSPPTWLGYRPAAVGLFAFAFLELVQPDRTSRPVLTLYVTAFIVISVPASLLLGSRWFQRGDPFGVVSDLYGALSPIGRRTDGRLAARGPVAGLSGVSVAPGLLAVVSVLLGSTAYDGFQGNLTWTTFTQSADQPTLIQTAGLAAFCLLVAASTGAAATLAGRLAGRPGRGVATAFAPSLVPIAAGYLVAHYWSLLVYGGQVTLRLLSDPLGTGADWLGTTHLTPNSSLIAPTLTACIQVAAIASGHVVGIVAAHDRALRLFPRRAAVVGQLPLLVLMVGYTVAGLLLLFSS